jgi:hypothetical protein
MKFIIVILTLILLQNCSKHKTALICGDHLCVNKAEAEKYFQENLSIEVKIIKKNKSATEEVDLVELNLVKSSSNQKQINIIQKDRTKEKIKILTKDEVSVIKKNIKKNKKEKKIKKNKKENQSQITKKKNATKEKNIQNKSKKIVNKTSKRPVDVCTIIEKCSIDEISKFLVEQGKKGKYPDITIRE